MPPAVAAVYEAYPPGARKCLLAIRQLIFDTAASLPAIGPLTETLKWSEPAYLTEASRSGTTIRLAWSPKQPASASLFVSCQTSLIESWRERYSDDLAFIGNREIRFPIGHPLPGAPVRHCIAMALTYHKRKSAP
ncbi:MAG: hypothetical protein CVT79_10695 [Alphaproteobacteria bacterium HGW-Alphaproteobacteria-18]|nr:MAG: hypothetical protein CVT79_10695 [Alphaproteobacteria bacterium HGW-Alphaproteobacteria-18]